MTIETDRDRLEILQTFGEPAIVGSRRVWGYYFDVSEPLEHASGQVIESSQPRMLVRDGDLPDLVWGTTSVTVRSRSYVVVSAWPDGAGLTELRMRDA